MVMQKQSVQFGKRGKMELGVRLVAAGELTVSHECIVVDNRGHDWA